MSDQPAGRDPVRPEDLLPTRATEYRTGALRLPDSVRLPVSHRDEPVTVPLRVSPTGTPPPRMSAPVQTPAPASPASATGLLDAAPGAPGDSVPRPTPDRDTDRP